MRVPEDKIWVEVAQIARAPMDVEGEANGRLFALEHDPYVHQNGPVSYKIHVELAGQDLVATGSAEAPLALLCGRCGRFFSTNVKISSFLRAYNWNDHPEVLDLTGDIREDLLLEVPPYPVCSPDCRGRCPQCGKNLNDGPCGCPPRPDWDEGSPWGELDNLGLGVPPEQSGDGPATKQ